MDPTLWLAVASPDKSSRLLADILPWLILLLGLVVVGGVIIYAIRRYLRHDASSTEDFTLADLRRMHAAGELTDEQFERAKAMMIGRLTLPSKSSSRASSPGNHEQPSN